MTFVYDNYCKFYQRKRCLNVVFDILFVVIKKNSGRQAALWSAWPEELGAGLLIRIRVE